MYIPAGVITLIGLAVVGTSSYSLSGAARGVGIRDINWVRMRKEEAPLEYYRIVMRTVAYLLVGLAILALGIFKLSANHWGFFA